MKIIISSALVLIGVVWLLALGWTYVVMSGISTPVSFAVIAGYYGPLSIGPILVIVGPILVLTDSYSKVGGVLALIGCAILTILVGYSTMQDIHPEPLQIRPPYGFDVCLIIVTLLSDWGAFRLFQMARSRVNPPR